MADEIQICPKARERGLVCTTAQCDHSGGYIALVFSDGGSFTDTNVAPCHACGADAPESGIWEQARRGLTAEDHHQEPPMTDKKPKPTITMKDVKNSSSVESHGYDAASQTLHIRFRGGVTYEYPNVPQSVVDGLHAAKSVGGYVAASIVKRFKGAKL